jgi:hypothetical protein
MPYPYGFSIFGYPSPSGRGARGEGGFVYTKLTNKKIPCNTCVAKLVSPTKDEERQMEIIAAAGAFIGLFALWVVLPKKFLKK